MKEYVNKQAYKINNENAVVVAESIEEAIKIYKKHFPDTDIRSIEKVFDFVWQ